MARKPQMKGEFTKKKFNEIIDTLVKIAKKHSSEKYHISIGTGSYSSITFYIHIFKCDNESCDLIMLDFRPWEMELTDEMLKRLQNYLVTIDDSDEFIANVKTIEEYCNAA